MARSCNWCIKIARLLRIISNLYHKFCTDTSFFSGHNLRCGFVVKGRHSGQSGLAKLKGCSAKGAGTGIEEEIFSLDLISLEFPTLENYSKVVAIVCLVAVLRASGYHVT
uniref:Uncharacterized protein n=1 Tax=Micrurus paraensis TaxID=1970185 RepID=A0A2D4JUN6_9SAUR